MWLLTVLAALAGPPVRWPEGQVRRLYAAATREAAFHDTALAGPDGEIAFARSVTLSVVLDCTSIHTSSWAIDVRCRVEDAGLVATPAGDREALEAAVAHTEARVEAAAVQLHFGRSGRLLEVRAMEPDGVLWTEFEGLSSWLYRALSPLDVRIPRRRRTWRLHGPAAGRLIADQPAEGLRVHGVRDGATWRQAGRGRWRGSSERLDVELSGTARFDADVGFVADAEVAVTARRRGRPEPVLWMRARVHLLGDAAVRPLTSRVVPGSADEREEGGRHRSQRAPQGWLSPVEPAQ